MWEGIQEQATKYPLGDILSNALLFEEARLPPTFLTVVTRHDGPVTCDT